MQSNNRDVASVWDMTQAIQYIQTFTNNLTFDEYLNDIRTISAVESTSLNVQLFSDFVIPPVP